MAQPASAVTARHRRSPTNHRAREVAESFGADPERYDRARPRYPDAVVQAIVAASPGPDVVGVGLGTGIAARQFQAAGRRVLGVEVDPRMAAWARRRGCCGPAAGRPRSGTAADRRASWPTPSPTSTAGRCPDRSPTASRRPPHRRGARRRRRRRDGIRAGGGFAEPELWSFDWERTCTRDEWLDQLPTRGIAAVLPGGAPAEVPTGVGAAVDGAGGSSVMSCTTVVATAARTA
ncbi:class I SAM-dependent methyltransferase [Saccharothrix sp. HUAS TT1]|uniref:class I SAM-dependent methyltransferase n=1 Tax=unclassified Saccharothrix TaxID=2593673 RepID=UPI00345C4EC2